MIIVIVASISGICLVIAFVYCYASKRTSKDQYQAGSMPNNKDEIVNPEQVIVMPPPPPAINPAIKNPAFMQASAPQQGTN
jgi:hypothetical protein